MKTTYEKALDFVLAKKHFEQTHKEETKLHHALRRCHEGFAKQMEKIETKLRRDTLALSLEYASEDEKGHLIVVEKTNYVYTKENRKLLDAGIDRLQDALVETPVEVEPYMAKSVPEDLTYEQKKAFNGFVLTFKEAEE